MKTAETTTRQTVFFNALLTEVLSLLHITHRAVKRGFGAPVQKLPPPPAPARADRLKIFTLNRKDKTPQLQTDLGLVRKG